MNKAENGVSGQDLQALFQDGLRAHQALGQFDKAIDSYHGALAIKPDLFEAWNNLKLATKAYYRWNRIGKRDKERKEDFVPRGFTAAARATPDYALLQYYLDRFSPDQADAAFDAAMEALPDKADETLTIDASNPRPALPPLFAGEIVALLHFARSGTGLLEGLLDFETTLAGRTGTDPEQFMRSGSCQLLRAGFSTNGGITPAC